MRWVITPFPRQGGPLGTSGLLDPPSLNATLGAKQRVRSLDSAWRSENAREGTVCFARRIGETPGQMRIELLYFPGCPHIEAARTQLREALRITGLALEWIESDSARGYGSPTILIDGVDVMGALPSSTGDSCRLYLGSDLAGAPPLKDLVRALSA